MTDDRFFSTDGPFSLTEIAAFAQAEISRGEPDRQYGGIAPLSSAGPDDVSFLDNKKYVDAFVASGAGACIVEPSFADRAPEGMALLVTPQPYHAYARVAAAFHAPLDSHQGVSPTAVVDPAAEIAKNACVGPGATIAAGARIGAGTSIGANTCIATGVIVGEGCRIGDNVTLQCCIVGNGVIIHPGVRVGQDGFGFALGPQGHLKVPQLGRVLIEDDVEIGANTTIDRGTGPDTVIGAGSKIDNLVQIGHNVRLGKGCIIVAQVGISGSTELGDFVSIGGQGGVAGHLSIGSGAQIAAQSGVMRNIDAGAKVGGSPAMPVSVWLRGVAMLEKLAQKKAS
ncbi:MAG: UDP-3-O-(3-hydroxymyristoyl)glucosamine N-acyltransferase [Rhodospirillales bacterium]